MQYFATPADLQSRVSLRAPTMSALIDHARSEVRSWPLPSLARIDGALDGPLPERAEISQLTRLGLNRITLAGTASLKIGERFGAVELVRFLRDCAGLGLAVDWTLDALDADVAATLVHVPPPRIADGSPAWEFYFGTYYWRNGNGFAQLVDLRSGASASKIWLDDPDLYEVFMLLQTPIRRSAVRSDLSAALCMLEAENVTFTAGDWIVALPYRLRKWPTPYGAM